MMNVARRKAVQLFASATVFWMALVLTPRALVDDHSQAQESAEIPVRMLDQTDDCIWCDPGGDVQPANCTDDPDDKPVWLNPDEPLEQPPRAPCLDDDDSDPSA